MFVIKNFETMLPENGRTLIYTANGNVSATLPLNDDQIVGTFELFIELLERSGYEVTKK
jgi:hypothetical protein